MADSVDSGGVRAARATGTEPVTRDGVADICLRFFYASVVAAGVWGGSLACLSDGNSDLTPGALLLFMLLLGALVGAVGGIGWSLGCRCIMRVGVPAPGMKVTVVAAIITFWSLCGLDDLSETFTVFLIAGGMIPLALGALTTTLSMFWSSRLANG